MNEWPKKMQSKAMFQEMFSYFKDDYWIPDQYFILVSIIKITISWQLKLKKAETSSFLIHSKY